MSRGFLSSLTGRRHLLQHVPTLKCGATFLLSLIGTRCVRIVLTLMLNALGKVLPIGLATGAWETSSISTPTPVADI